MSHGNIPSKTLLQNENCYKNSPKKKITVVPLALDFLQASMKLISLLNNSIYFIKMSTCNYFFSLE